MFTTAALSVLVSFKSLALDSAAMITAVRTDCNTTTLTGIVGGIMSMEAVKICSTTIHGPTELVKMTKSMNLQSPLMHLLHTVEYVALLWCPSLPLVRWAEGLLYLFQPSGDADYSNDSTALTSDSYYTPVCFIPIDSVSSIPKLTCQLVAPESAGPSRSPFERKPYST